MSVEPLAKRPNARKKQKYNPTSSLVKGVVEILSPPTLDGSEMDAVPEDLVYIGSYNWVHLPSPTIVVPGSPRIWADRQMPMAVPLDSGKNYIDQNAHRMKKLTLLPLIRAVQDLTDQGVTQQFDWPSVDFVVDRGRLRRLLAWVLGSSDQWRMDTQLAGSNTVLLSGQAPVTKERSGRSSSYGFNYEEASTRPVPGLENGTGHHRIVAYNFGGLKVVVRFEVDACLPYDAAQASSPPSKRPSTSWKAAKNKSSFTSSLNSPGVRILRGGSSDVPQTHLLEIKTHKTMKSTRWSRTYPQLYLSQTPHVYHAYHNNGTFTNINKFTLGQRELVGIDKSAQEGFKKLRKLLGCIRSLVHKHGATRVSLVCVGKTLSVYKIPKGESCLPEDALALFVV